MEEAINLRAGMTFIKDGKLIKVIESNHHKPGKGNTVMQMKLYDIRAGSNVVTTMRPSEKVEMATIESKDAQYLYTMDELAYFMDLESYEQYEIPVSAIQEELKYLLENTTVKIDFYGSEVIGITLPTVVELTVKETMPSIKGATVTGSGKPATMETGAVVMVPDFISEGDKLVINTQNGTYQKRA